MFQLKSLLACKVLDVDAMTKLELEAFGKALEAYETVYPKASYICTTDEPCEYDGGTRDCLHTVTLGAAAACFLPSIEHVVQNHADGGCLQQELEAKNVEVDRWLAEQRAVFVCEQEKLELQVRAERVRADEAVRQAEVVREEMKAMQQHHAAEVQLLAAELERMRLAASPPPLFPLPPPPPPLPCVSTVTDASASCAGAYDVVCACVDRLFDESNQLRTQEDLRVTLDANASVRDVLRQTGLENFAGGHTDLCPPWMGRSRRLTRADTLFVIRRKWSRLGLQGQWVADRHEFETFVCLRCFNWLASIGRASPILLPCLHTVCRDCALNYAHIAAAHASTDESFISANLRNSKDVCCPVCFMA